jgi:DNA-binding transcriptional MerR regulator
MAIRKRAPQAKVPADAVEIGSDKLYFKIGEVAEIVGVPAYVLRYWETEFKAIKPQKSRTQQRVYRRNDVAMLLRIKHLLYEKKFTIAGARSQLKEKPEACEVAAPNGIYVARQSVAKLRAVLDETQELLEAADRRDRAAADPAMLVRKAGGAMAVMEAE